MLSADDLKQATSPVVAVPAFQGTVGMRAMTAQRWAEIEKRFGKGEAERNPMAYRIALLHATLCNSDGGPLFASEKECDSVLGLRDMREVKAAFTEAQRVNGLLAEQAEDREGNSESSRG